ncbi:hypothetical protein SELMODRAFT_106106 [Selaginella moellendorffii]|uniref:Peroxidase n=1 Tax=Selaginella moellendorffii TaxID=88036 RepID=D8S101_SELML|nr:peroxidase 46 [Selaginella moellendorffii]EFJ22137.1 hypothetical protein SELMODRAFT_106106 [Selaginella moellendorffii]|eukprot:XP_002977027.1 peroxidase 46 [Selaginella moellendorffii]
MGTSVRHWKQRLVLVCLALGSVCGQLAFDFYANSCPRVEAVVANAIRSATFFDSTLPPKLLRLMFHDCFIEGCDGSILVDSTANHTAEKEDESNKTVDGYAAIDSAKSALEFFCPGVVSCADIVALAAREAVIMMGGPQVQIPMGRRDGLISKVSNVRGNIPDTTLTLDQLTKVFNSKGLSQKDLIVLSGAHTVGLAHCFAFNERFHFSSNGSVKVDSTLDPGFARQLLQACPERPNPRVAVAIDPTTPNAFDNAYYRNLQNGKGLFGSDQVLFTDRRSRQAVNSLSGDSREFFGSWADSFLKLSVVHTKTGNQGEVRRRCRAFN